MRYFTETEINAASFGVEDGFDYMEEQTLEMLDMLRHNCGFPFVCTCFYRSVEHDKSKGRSGKSQHCSGRGVDISYKNMAQAVRIVAEAGKLGFIGIAINEKLKFVHVDTRPGSTIVTWEY